MRKVKKMYDWNRPNRRRLSIDIPQEVYMQIRTLAMARNCTLTKWVIRAVLEQAHKETGVRGNEDVGYERT